MTRSAKASSNVASGADEMVIRKHRVPGYVPGSRGIHAVVGVRDAGHRERWLYFGAAARCTVCGRQPWVANTDAKTLSRGRTVGDRLRMDVAAGPLLGYPRLWVLRKRRGGVWQRSGMDMPVHPRLAHDYPGSCTADSAVAGGVHVSDPPQKPPSLPGRRAAAAVCAKPKKGADAISTPPNLFLCWPLWRLCHLGILAAFGPSNVVLIGVDLCHGRGSRRPAGRLWGVGDARCRHFNAVVVWGRDRVLDEEPLRAGRLVRWFGKYGLVRNVVRVATSVQRIVFGRINQHTAEAEHG